MKFTSIDQITLVSFEMLIFGQLMVQIEIRRACPYSIFDMHISSIFQPIGLQVQCFIIIIMGTHETLTSWHKILLLRCIAARGRDVGIMLYVFNLFLISDEKSELWILLTFHFLFLGHFWWEMGVPTTSAPKSLGPPESRPNQKAKLAHCTLGGPSVFWANR